MAKKPAGRPGIDTPWVAPKDVVRLSGGNPQVPLGYGEAPVRWFIAAMPGWQSAVGKRLDALITEAAPGVMKAVKWNTPMYGMELDHYFLGFHSFDKYIKVSFNSGARLQPVPPGKSKQANVRYLDIREGDALDEAQFKDWVEQASQLPGEKL
jgi:hypothetical protein